MSIIESVRKYLQTCPLLKGGTLNVDFLPPEAATYSVDVVPVKPVLKAYMDGSSQRQFLFVLATALITASLSASSSTTCAFSRSLPSGWTSRTEPVRSPISGTDETRENWRSRPPAMFSHPIRTRHGIRSSAACPISRKENDK